MEVGTLGGVDLSHLRGPAPRPEKASREEFPPGPERVPTGRGGEARRGRRFSGEAENAPLGCGVSGKTAVR